VNYYVQSQGQGIKGLKVKVKHSKLAAYVSSFSCSNQIISSNLAGVLKPPRGFSRRKNRDPSQDPGMKGQGQYSK
jgi:hypothetical protein